VNIEDCLDRFDLNDETVIDKQVNSVPASQISPFVPDWQADLSVMSYQPRSLPRWCRIPVEL